MQQQLKAADLATFTLAAYLLLLLQCCAATPYAARYKAEYCKDAQTGRELLVGDVFTRPGQCIRVQCLGTLQLWEDSCQVPRELKGSCLPRPPANEYLDYPKCCPMYECKTYETNAHAHVEQTNTYDHYGNFRKTHLTELIIINDPNKLGANGATPKRQYSV